MSIAGAVAQRGLFAVAALGRAQPRHTSCGSSRGCRPRQTIDLQRKNAKSLEDDDWGSTTKK
jgi:hypothetical protein